MLARIFGNSLQTKTHSCADLRGRFPDFAAIDARQNGIHGFSQEIYSKSTIAVIGAGGLGSEVAEGAIRKGIGRIIFFDGDTVEPSNLNRQLFTQRDIGKNKSICLAKNLMIHGYMGSTLIAHPHYFQGWLSSGGLLSADVILCGVDNDATRIFVSRYGLRQRVPVVYIAVSRDANQGYVFVQEPEGACFVCLQPDVIDHSSIPCPNTPAVKDILKVVAGVALFAIDTLICSRPCNWNYRLIQLAGFMPDRAATIRRNEGCRLCGQPRSI